MPLSVACQMDPIDRIDIKGDSTFALLLEAQHRGHKLFYYTPPNLSLLGGRLIAHGFTLEIEDKVGAHYRLIRAAHRGPVATGTWCCCARTRRSTCPTSPPRTCWSASIPRRWW